MISVSIPASLCVHVYSFLTLVLSLLPHLFSDPVRYKKVMSYSIKVDKSYVVVKYSLGIHLCQISYVVGPLRSVKP